EHQLRRPPEQAALLVDVVLPDLHGQQRRLAVGGEAAGESHAEADLDRVGRAGHGSEPDGGEEDERGDDGDTDQSPGPVHVVPSVATYITRRGLPWDRRAGSSRSATSTARAAARSSSAVPRRTSPT